MKSRFARITFIAALAALAAGCATVPPDPAKSVDGVLVDGGGALPGAAEATLHAAPRPSCGSESIGPCC